MYNKYTFLKIFFGIIFKDKLGFIKQCKMTLTIENA